MPALAHEAGTAVQVPTNDEHGRARPEQRLPKRPEIIGGVDQNRGAPGPLETPNISVWCKNHKKPIDAEPLFGRCRANARTTKWSQPGATHNPPLQPLGD